MTVTSSPFKIKISSVDAEPPTVSISTPSLGAVIIIPPGQPLVVSGTASDLKSGVDYVETLIDSGGYQRATGTTSWVISFSGVPAGTRTVRARSRDKAGNYSAEKVTSFTVQNVTIPPPPPILPPPPSTTADVVISPIASAYEAKRGNTLIGSNADAVTLFEQVNKQNESLRFAGSQILTGRPLIPVAFSEIQFATFVKLKPNSNCNMMDVGNATGAKLKKIVNGGLDGDRVNQAPYSEHGYTYTNSHAVFGHGTNNFDFGDIEIKNTQGCGVKIINGGNIKGWNYKIHNTGSIGITGGYAGSIVDSYDWTVGGPLSEVYDNDEQNYEFGVVRLHVDGRDANGNPAGKMGHCGRWRNAGHLTIEPDSFGPNPAQETFSVVEGFVASGSGMISCYRATNVTFRKLKFLEAKEVPNTYRPGWPIESGGGNPIQMHSCAGGIIEDCEGTNIDRDFIRIANSNGIEIDGCKVNRFGLGPLTDRDRIAHAGIHFTEGSVNNRVGLKKANIIEDGMGYGIILENAQSANANIASVNTVRNNSKGQIVIAPTS